MVVGRYLPANAQDAPLPHPQTAPLMDSVPPPPPRRTQTPPSKPGPVHDQTPDPPAASTPQPQSSTHPSRPPTTPRHRHLEDIHNTPIPGSSQHRSNGGHDDHDDHEEEDLPGRKRRKKTNTRQKENPIALLTTAIERNTQVIEEQHRQSQELLERTAEAQQKMFGDLMGVLRES